MIFMLAYAEYPTVDTVYLTSMLIMAIAMGVESQGIMLYPTA